MENNPSNFIWESVVRDYELDSQGIVNNATYLNYFEHCRHLYAKILGVDFHEFFQMGYVLVVASIAIEYKRSLRAYENFYVTAKISHFDERRIYFEQEIKRSRDHKLITSAVVTVACVNNKTGKSLVPDILKEKLNQIPC